MSEAWAIADAQVGPYIRQALSEPLATAERKQPALTESQIGHAFARVDRCIATYVERCRSRIPSFVECNFSLAQTWRLQKRTLWFDLVCAPLNSGWALPHLAVQKAAEALTRVGYLRPAQWARRVPPGVRTGYQRQIERILCAELLEWDPERGAALPQGFLQELEAVPQLRGLLEALKREPSNRKLVELLRQFSSGRALVSDVSGTLLMLAMSWSIFGSTSVGLRGIAHGVAKQQAHDRAASRFFLGKRAGSAFYNVFQPRVSEFTVWVVLVFLVIGLSVGAMACTILSDPIRKRLGFHRNRLEMLLDEIERELIVLAHKALAAASIQAVSER